MKALSSLPPGFALGSAGRRLRLVSAWVLLTVAFFQPAAFVLDGALDPSIFAAYAYYTAHGFQFGPDVVAMAGPYGFVMYGQYYGGDLFWLRLVAELAVEGAFAALLLWFFLRLPRQSWTRWLWFPAHLLFTTALPDLPIAWTMWLAGLCLLEEGAAATARWRDLALPVLLGWLALFKGTHLFLSLATLAPVLVVTAKTAGARRATRIALAYAAGLLGFWLLAGQNPLHLPAYVRGTLHLARSYNDAMSVVEPRAIFWRGLLTLAGLGLALGVTAWARRRRPRDLAALALLAGNTFVMWKHGFVRADSHTVIFFCFACVAALAWYLDFFAREPQVARGTRAAAFGLTVALLLGVNAGAFDPHRPWLPYLAGRVWPDLRAHALYLLQPGERRREIEQRLQDQRDLAQLPEIADTIGRAPIDFFGSHQGVLPLNGFNYRPRPMGGGAFNVYDEYLMRLNEDFVRDPARRPAFYALRPDLVDNRFAAQDDGRALLALVQGYRPEILVRNLLLLRAGPPAPPAVPRPVGRRTFRFGESVPVPAVGADEILLARFEVSPNWRGRAQSALYKMPPVTITWSEPNAPAPLSRRLVPVMARVPFIFSPVIEDIRDVLGLYAAGPGRQPTEFVLSTPGRGAFQKELTVEFTAVPRPAPADPYQLHGLVSRLAFPFANAIPASITPAFQENNFRRYLHAPGEITWNLTGEERELVFHFGLDPRAYTEGTTNGVVFIAEIRGPSGAVTPFFQRSLQPRTNPADRGQQVARAPLPVYAPGSRLVLRTDPGQYGDNSWDWSYVTRIDLRQGRYDATQFPGFRPRPDFAEGEHVGVVGLNGAEVVMLHVPAQVRFNLTGREQRLSLNFGFLEGAYSAGGNTGGADFVVELQIAGQPPREIFRRTLKPLTTPADRGAQFLTLALPATVPGEVLTVRTLPAAGADNNWGWTYVSQLLIE